MLEAGILFSILLGAVTLLVFWRSSGAGAPGAALARLSERLDGVEKRLREDLRALRDESGTVARALRDEVAAALKNSADSMVNAQAKTLAEWGRLQREQIEGVTRQLKDLTDRNEQRLERLRQTTELHLKSMQESNEKKLEEMRKTVDEKLQGTLEKRLGDSFKLVHDQLEAVNRGLGEMQSLATGVGDLKRVLTNVKARGTWGEVQLGALLEQILTPEQFARNVATREGSRDLVEFAVRLPGPERSPGSQVYLPIDSKFPQEPYLRLMDAVERADPVAQADAQAALVRAVRVAAQDIRDKYLDPPHTTDFALMFLPTEGLFAELLRQPGVVEELQDRYRVVVTGPTTLSATLSSLRLGFRTLAIEQRASEVWRVLGAVKTEFGRFGEVLEKVKRQLQTASRTIDESGIRTRQMERKLRDVEQLPEAESAQVLDLVAEPVEPVAVEPNEAPPAE